MGEKQGKQNKSQNKSKVPPKIIDPKLENVAIFKEEPKKNKKS